MSSGDARLNVLLYTLNLKHYTALPNVNVLRPY
jgi:hypothetical protein